MKFTSFSVRQRKGRSWQGLAKYKDEETGEWRTVSKSFPEATGKRAAEQAAREWFNELNARAEEPGEDAGGKALEASVAEFLSAYTDGCAVHAEASTIYDYRYTIRRKVAPYPIASIPVVSLTASDVRAWLSALSEDYGATSVNKAFVFVRSALRQAVSDGNLARNPTDGVKPPKRPSPKPNAITEEQRAELAQALARAAQTPDIVGMRIAFYTGMREGEVCALRWRDVDLAAQTLSVRSTIGKDGGRLYVKEPKTAGSRRTVFMPDALTAAVRARRETMMEEAMAAGVAFSPNMFVLGSIDKDPKTADYRFLHPHVLWERWRVFSDMLGLTGTQGRRPTFHDLRHTFATAAIAGGVDVKTVSSALGHASAAMTLNVYADADPEAKRRAAGAVAKALEGNRVAGKGLVRAASDPGMESALERGFSDMRGGRFVAGTEAAKAEVAALRAAKNE